MIIICLFKFLAKSITSLNDDLEINDNIESIINNEKNLINLNLKEKKNEGSI